MNKTCILCGKLTQKRRKRCMSCNTKIRRYRTKLRAILYLGGKCKRCDYVGPHYEFDIHHIGNKDFQLSNVANKSWEVVKKELDKCELLCVKCHRKEHHVQENEAFWHEVFNYQGKDGEWLTEEVIKNASLYGYTAR